jgi:hypothetical protein
MRIVKDHLPWETGNLPCTGPNLWVCPECGGINAWNYEDAERAAAKLKINVVVCTGSAFDNLCGHCYADIVKPDSPILAECYTHAEQA